MLVQLGMYALFHLDMDEIVPAKIYRPFCISQCDRWKLPIEICFFTNPMTQTSLSDGYLDEAAL